MKQVKAKVISNRKISNAHYIIELDCPDIASRIRPGQFVHIRCDNGIRPFLRRPFSLHRIVSPSTIQVLYKVVGLGTRLLSEKKVGDLLDILGPCGNGFDVRSLVITKQLSVILVAGGRGTAPLVALAEELKDKNMLGEKPMAIIGACTKDDILCEKDFKRLGCIVHIVTEDCSLGEGGLVTDILQGILRTTNECEAKPPRRGRTTIYACGPNAMFRHIYDIIKDRDIHAYCSFEELIACGIGVCMGCVVKIQNPKSKIQNGFEYKRVCKEGPVFNLKDVIWG